MFIIITIEPVVARLYIIGYYTNPISNSCIYFDYILPKPRPKQQGG